MFLNKLNLTASAFLFLFSGHAMAQEVGSVGCKESDYVSVDGNASVATQGSSYTPKCLKIKKGSSVTIAASSHHPLQGIGDETNPIFDEFGGAVQPKTVTFASAGTFGYYCLAHSDDTGSGMAGAIWVVE